MADPSPPLEAALDAAGARGAGLRSAIQELHPSAVATPSSPLAVLVATFNAAGRPPPPGLDLAPWLAPPPPPPSTSSPSPVAPPDLVAITFQEAVPLSAGNIATGAVGAAGVEAWLGAAERALRSLAPGGAAAPPYTRLAAAQLVGLVLGVWVREGAAPRVRAAQATAVGGGGGGLRLGNKGLVAVRLLVDDAPAVFVGAHLPSGDGPGDAARRDACLADCLQRGAFPAPPPPASSSSSGAGLGAALRGAAAAFLAGDLNYRLLAPDATVRKCLRAAAAAEADERARAGLLERLAALDELSPGALAGRGAGAAWLTGWREAGRLSAFMPTFKLRVGGGAYVGDGDGAAAEGDGDGAAAGAPSTPTPTTPEPLDGGATARTPAWTDRILFTALPAWGGREGGGASDALPPLLVTPHAYASAPAIALSDHTPVAATFSFTPFSLDPTLLAAALETARRSADAAAMEAVPRCEAAPKVLALGRVPPGGAVRAGCVLQNTGRTPAAWELAPQPAAAFGVGGGGGDGHGAAALLRHPPWLGVRPTSGTLLPGEAVALEVRARGGQGEGGGGEGGGGGAPPPSPSSSLLGLHAAAAGAASIDAVLVLRVEGGNDEFVLVSTELSAGAEESGGLVVEDAAAALAASTLADPPPPPRDTG